MKKFLFLITLLTLMGGANSYATNTLNVDLSGAMSYDGNVEWTWDGEAKKGHFVWKGTWSNAMVMPGLSGNLSDYTTVNWNVEEGTGSDPVKNHFRILIYFSNGAAQITYNPYDGGNPVDMTGEKSVTFAEMGVTAANLVYVSSIKISGAGHGNGDVYVKSFSLTGPDVVPVEATKVYEAPVGTKDLNGMTGADDNKWSITYPTELGPGTGWCGSIDNDNKSLNITSYDYLQFVVTNVEEGKSLSLRVFVSEESRSDNDKRHCLYPYPIAEVTGSTNYKTPYYITAPGTYVVKISDYPLLRGFKTGNADVNNNGKITISQSYLSSGENPVAYKETGKYAIIGRDNTGAASLTAALADPNAVFYDAIGITGTGIDLTSVTNPNALFKANSGALSNTNNVITSGTCDNLVLTDGHPFKAPENFTADAASYSTTINAAGAGTLCLPFAATIPGGVTAYTLTYSNGADKAVATPVETTIPANTPVLLNGSGAAEFTGSGAVSASATNVRDALTGVFEATTVPENSYVLQNGDNGLSFYKVVTDDIVANPFRAYLTALLGARTIGITYGGVTNINEVKANKVGEKDVYYNLKGQRVSNPTKGIFIKNGVKVSF